jgi:ketosteroid isomerase-like protein
MKNWLIYLLFIFLVAGTACVKKVDITKEKEAIKALISNETQAFLKQDTAKLSSFYIHDEDQTRLSMQCDTVNLYRGWRELSPVLNKADLSAYNEIKNTKEFLNVKVIGNVAWAMYKDIWTGKRNDQPLNITIYCTMILEKVAGEWKISGFSLHLGNK